MRVLVMRILAPSVVIAVLVGVVPAAFAGDLTPPGSPASTMKTLQEVYDKADEAEARTPISSIRYTIDEPGSYYLTQNLGPAAPDTDGIVIEADNVTLDLNGFAVIGPGRMPSSPEAGISVSGTRYNIAVRNGTIRDWPDYGAKCDTAENSIFQSLRCYNNRLIGLFVGVGCRVEGNTCHTNGAAGITALGAGTVTGNTCCGNGNSGIIPGSGSTVTSNTCSTNDNHGISAGSGCLIDGNTCWRNDAHGINLYAGCRVVNNACTENGYDTGTGAGINAHSVDNCVEHNLVVGNDIGIECGAGCYIASNRASGNSPNYSLGTSTVGAGDLANVQF